MSELAGKTALVTGAGTGIGAAVAEQLAKAGARVLLVSRTTARIDQVARSIRDQGNDAVAMAGDIRGELLLTDLARHAPRIDVLVNNAAVFATYAPVENVAASEVEELLDVDLAASLRLIQHVLPGMKEAGWGRIINIGSVAAGLGAAGQVTYSTAKAGLQGLTRSVAIETARHGITCNLIEPGLVETERTSARIEQQTREHLISATPVGRAGQPSEIAYAVTFLASTGAAAITGATLPVDGGIGIR